MRRALFAVVVILTFGGLAGEAATQGCPGEAAPGLASGRTVMKGGSTDTITCPRSGPRNFIIIGASRLTPPFDLGGPPAMCAVGCTLGCFPLAVIPTLGSTLQVTAPPVGRTFTLCVQCLHFDIRVNCSTMSGILPLTIRPC